MSFFGPKGAPKYKSEGHYLDIVRDQRIVMAGVMYAGSTPTSTTMCTVELLRNGTGTRLILTDQSALLGGETREDREIGWGQILTRLEKEMGREDAAHS
jgi:uncharacterized protein YndB with AHSA1/START domain